jgi:hypothetical protein
LGGLVALGCLHDVGHFVRVVLVHLATEGFDEYFFAHKRLQAVTGLYPGADGRCAPSQRAIESAIIAGSVKSMKTQDFSGFLKNIG